VVVYGTQTDLQTQLHRAGIPMFLYQHAGLPDVTTTIRELGARVGSVKESTNLAIRIDAEIADVKRRVAGRPRPRTLLVFGRDAETLRGIYASGGVGFLHDVLEAAGGTNVFADVKRQSIQTTSELAVARAPDVIVEIGIDTASTNARNLAAWSAFTIPPGTKRIYQPRGAIIPSLDPDRSAGWPKSCTQRRSWGLTPVRGEAPWGVTPVRRLTPVQVRGSDPNEDSGVVELGKRQRVDAARAEAEPVDGNRRPVDDDEREFDRRDACSV
jgi:hypothetical protein